MTTYFKDTLIEKELIGLRKEIQELKDRIIQIERSGAKKAPDQWWLYNKK